MKKHIAGFLIVACLGTFSWAQGNKPDLFDTTKSAQELEIMKGILGTTLSFVTQNLQRQEASKASTKPVATPFGSYSTAVSWRSANINAFYLYGQGAVFIMPTSSLRISGYGSSGRGAAGNLDVYYLEERLAEATARDREVRAQVADAARRSAAAAQAVAAAVPPQAAKAPTAPTPPAPVQLKEEELRKKVAEAQERVKKSREEIEANQAKFLAALEQIKVHLIEAIANHGDSLTTVKPNEYISLVIMTDDLEFRSESGPRNRQQVISVQKSMITEYKAGRLTLDNLKQKILQYSE
jgi:hypothetical protein